jgi:hypothetical protein
MSSIGAESSKKNIQGDAQMFKLAILSSNWGDIHTNRLVSLRGIECTYFHNKRTLLSKVISDIKGETPEQRHKR